MRGHRQIQGRFAAAGRPGASCRRAAGRARQGAWHACGTGASRRLRCKRARARRFAHGTDIGTAGRSALPRESDVEYAVPDQRRRISTAPERSACTPPARRLGGTGGPAVGQWYLRAPAGDVQSSINVEPAWNVTTGSRDIVVARDRHRRALRSSRPAARRRRRQPAARLRHDQQRPHAPTTATVATPTRPIPATGSRWRKLADRQAVLSVRHRAEDSSWHGTQTSGLIGALTNNGIGMASVARNVRVLPVRALGKCGGFDSDIIAGDALGGRPRRAGRARQPDSGARAQPEPRWRQRVHGGLRRRRRRDQRGRRGRRRVRRQQHRARRRIARELPGRHRRRRPAPRRHEGRVLRPRARRSASARRPATASTPPPGTPCLYPILTTSNAGRPRRCRCRRRLDLHRQLQLFARHELFGAAGGRHRRADAFGAADADAGRGARRCCSRPRGPFPTTGARNADGTPLPQCVAPQPDRQRRRSISSNATARPRRAARACSTPARPCSRRRRRARANYSGSVLERRRRGPKSGWGINFAHQGDIIFATWFTYDADRQSLVAGDDGEQDRRRHVRGHAVPDHRPAVQRVPFPPIGSGGATGPRSAPATADVQRCEQRDVRLHGQRDLADEGDHAPDVRPGAAVHVRCGKSESGADQQLSGPVVGRAGRIGIGLGHQSHAPGQTRFSPPGSPTMSTARRCGWWRR